MKKLIQPHEAPVHIHLVPCYLSDGEVMVYTAFERFEDEDEYPALYVYVYAHQPNFFQRLKQAILYLFGNRLSENGILMGQTSMNKLKSYLEEVDNYWNKLK